MEHPNASTLIPRGLYASEDVGFHSDNSWRPILSPHQAVVAREIANEVVKATSSSVARAHQRHGRVDVCLASGATGIALLHHYFAANWASEDGSLSDTVGLLDLALQELSTSAPAPWLYAGYSGFAWAIAHLQALGPTAPDEIHDLNLDDFDALIEAELDISPWMHDYDLIQGLVGLGVYGLERARCGRGEAILTRCIDRLYEIADSQANGIAWYHPVSMLTEDVRSAYPRGWYNVGIAHGVAGVVAFLARTVRVGANQNRSRELLLQATRWLAAEVREDENGYWVPTYIDPDPIKNSPHKARTAWCYGSPGVAVALLDAASVLDDSSLRTLALRLAMSSADRTIEYTGVRDASLCHGSSGLAHCFARLYHATQESRFKDAALRWFASTMQMRVNGEGFCGFRYLTLPNHTPVWKAESGFLEGAAGIALVLLGLSSTRAPEWDRVLLMDLANQPTNSRQQLSETDAADEISR